MLNEPLHDTKVEHHLHEGNEENYGAQNTSEEPGLCDDGVLIEKEDGANSGFLQEV